MVAPFFGILKDISIREEKLMLEGIVPLFKQRGMTSADCVYHCRKIFQTRRVGHSGTLDPNVEGVLPICINKGTKVVKDLMDSGKIYQGEITLGFATETEDLDGAIITQAPLIKPFTRGEIDVKMQELVGDIIQIPPMYSAVKVNGKRLYEYARNGEEVERPKREIHVDYFKQVKEPIFDPPTGYQKIYFEVGCGKGTYVRTLAVDLGEKLGVPAVMSDLIRLKSGGFKVGQAITLDQLRELDEVALAQAVYPIDYAWQDYPRFDLNAAQWKIIKNGGFLRVSDFNKPGEVPAPRVVLYYNNELRALYQYNAGKERYQVETMINNQE